MHLIIQSLKDLEVGSPDIKRCRMLVIDTYNAINKMQYSPIEPPQISFDGYKPFSTEMIEYINNFKTIHSLLIKYVERNKELIYPHFQYISLGNSNFQKISLLNFSIIGYTKNIIIK